VNANWTAIAIYLGAFLIAALVTTAATPLVIRLATHLGVIDGIDEERRVHTVPTPRIGGLAVFFGFSVALSSCSASRSLRPRRSFPRWPLQRLASTRAMTDQFEAAHGMVGLLFGGMLILGVGVWDDVMGMRPRNKFSRRSSWRSPRCCTVHHSRHHQSVDHNPGTNWIDFPLWLGVPLTLVWYVGMMNAINFIDGLDGLLAGVASISSLFLFVIAVTHGDPVVALVVISLAGATLGFLRFNSIRRKSFSGDAGSLFIGYVFATVSILGASKTAIAMSVVIPLVVLALRSSTRWP